MKMQNYIITDHKYFFFVLFFYRANTIVLHALLIAEQKLKKY